MLSGFFVGIFALFVLTSIVLCAACFCNQFGYAPVCAKGLTWKNRCDAECSGRNCGRDDVCENLRGDKFAPTFGGDGASKFFNNSSGMCEEGQSYSCILS